MNRRDASLTDAGVDPAVIVERASVERAAPDRVCLRLQADRPIPELTMSFDQALRLGWSLLLPSEDAPESGSLFEETPMASVSNPRTEVIRSDTGQMFLAVKPQGMRPLIIQLDRDRLRALLLDLGEAYEA